MQNPYQQKQREKRDRQIRKLYPKATMEQIGQKFGITKQRAQQILKAK